MKCYQSNLSYLSIILLIIPFLTSCHFLGLYEDIPVDACNSSYQSLWKDTIPLTSGHVTSIQVEVNGVPVQKWVIIPNSPKDKIYDPCNLPYEVKSKWKEINFSAYILENVSPVQDTLLDGLIPIELTKVQQ